MLNGEAAGGAAGSTEDSTREQGAKSSPDLLQMLKAAERRCTPQGQGPDGSEASETGETRETVTEALKTDMVSKNPDCTC